MTVHYLPLDLAKTPRENLFDMVKHANQTEPWIDLITPESFVILDVTPLANPYEITSEEIVISPDTVLFDSATLVTSLALYYGQLVFSFAKSV